MSRMMFSSVLNLCNTSSFFTRLVQLTSIFLRDHISQSTY